ncbi:PQQ-dependent sugar dehydrogenase [Parahaliea sp. F7430]|uniref:PQQ-dependent sugar dehydrogenase n=1 Tax=Sediminihaliea albiluteola TaxID=2758564 RepID=A0A7W2TUC0_9GAMM|nr:PQQ-dependent sugar dehydrogenase [Sediminihaliea albiluteola]MBA6412082.1 PQQ-dependent sugar dehydrogenase [Sediminihaliea albiluteola]
MKSSLVISIKRLVMLALLGFSAACVSEQKLPFELTSVAQFEEPWAMTFLPDGRLLVTEKPGRLLLLSRDGQQVESVSGLPQVDYGGQGGLGDIVLHPDFSTNGLVYLSYVEAGDDDTRGAAVARAVLDLSEEGAATLHDLSVIWRQTPKVTGRGHFAHRIALSDSKELFISSGERQAFDPAQDMSGNLGKIVRLRDDGSIPSDNPFVEQAGVSAEIWSLGHRNPLGLAFDAQGRLWSHEMGPAHGDELNLILPGRNYGYPLVSNGNHYNGDPIPDHHTRPDLEAPKAYWVPAISPAGLMFYDADLFPQWQGSAFIGSLSAKALLRVVFDGDEAREAERFPMGSRIREVEQGPEGAIWLLEDDRNESKGRLLKLTPRQP